MRPSVVQLDFGMKISDDLQVNSDEGSLFTEEEFQQMMFDSPRKTLSKRIKPSSSSNKKKRSKEKPFLVLWDIENINFLDDQKTIEKQLKSLGIRNTTKYLTYHIRKNRGCPWWLKQYGDNVEWRKIQLRRLGWILDEKRDADKQLKKYYYQYIDRVDGIVIISADSDFAELVQDAMMRGVKAHLFFDKQKPKWVEVFPELKTFQLRV